MNKSDTSIATIKVKNDKFIFLKKYPLIIATAIIGVKFGGCGISLANAKINIKAIGKISFFKFFDKFCINLIYPSYPKIKRPIHLRIIPGSLISFVHNIIYIKKQIISIL